MDKMGRKYKKYTDFRVGDVHLTAIALDEDGATDADVAFDLDVGDRRWGHLLFRVTM